VSATPSASAQQSVPNVRSHSDDPFHNPSYPARTHYHEREKLEASLREADERVNAARHKLDTASSRPQKAALVRLYHQLMGARDQIAECARRIPLEAADLYTEDNERYLQAAAALERTWAKWQSAAAGG